MFHEIRRLVFIALFAALFIVMSAIKIDLGFTPVPITLQNLAIMLAGAFLGAGPGFASIAIVVALTATGLPLLHGQGGITYIAGPTGGFILIFPVCALLIGFFAARLLRSEKFAGNRILLAIALFFVFELFGSALAYIGGVPWFMNVTGYSLERALAASCYPFLPGDAIKSLLAAILTVALRPYLPAVRGYGNRRATE